MLGRSPPAKTAHAAVAKAGVTDRKGGRALGVTPIGSEFPRVDGCDFTHPRFQRTVDWVAAATS